MATSMEQLQQWQAGTVVDLQKDPNLPVEVMEGLRRIGRGELIRLDGELGVRLIEVYIDSPANGGSST